MAETFFQLKVFVKTNAKNTEIIEVNESVLHIAIHAPAREGAANEELCRYLAKRFKIPKTKIVIKKGAKSRHKLLQLPFNDELRRLLN